MRCIHADGTAQKARFEGKANKRKKKKKNGKKNWNA
jgi:hypothetical protein